MKKNILRIFATASVVVALVFVIVLLVAAFGGIGEEDFNNGLVQGLFVALAIVFILLSAATLTFLFINDEAAKEIVLRADKEGATRTTVGVVKKIAKETVALVEGAKCTRCAIVANDYGVRLKITIKVKDIDVGDAERYVRACLEDAFLGKLNFKFYSIEIKVNQLKSKYAVDVNKVKAESDAEAKAEECAETEPTADAVVETVAEAEVVATVDETTEENPVDVIPETEETPAHEDAFDPTTLDSPVE